MELKAILLLLQMSFILVLGGDVINLNQIQSRCNKTPNPEICHRYMTQNSYISTPIHKDSDFLNLSIKLALDQAMYAQTNTYALGSKCRNGYDKAAWTDCMSLYTEMVERLNKTAYCNSKSNSDTQTWLSTAKTLFDTCETGFDELGVSNYMPILMKNDVSSLISNALHLNMGSNNYEPSSYTEGFPSWTRPGDRKLLASSSVQSNVVVAQDGSGHYKTVSEAVTTASKRSGTKRYVIYVKKGTYRENVVIKSENIMLVGDGIGKTIITGSRSVGGGSTTFNSATLAVTGDGFIGKSLTIRNTAGAKNHQAVALRSGSDLSVFYKCSFEGYQDTLYVHSNRQFYRECNIYGTVDFIFGNAAVVLQNCKIYARYPPNKTNTITAQGRTDPNQNTGISIHQCVVKADSDLKGASNVKTYLGRPWKEYSRTVYMRTYLDSLIDPAGWMEWDGDYALDTLYYGEYRNSGNGSSTTNRVKWKGYRVIKTASEASKFTVEEFISGDSWLPATKVPYTSGL
ncbi:hypothetical protein ACFE04_026534 [Oxalis oulophora]